MFFFFFFQAEDGIRDAQESRGLGDVYKRQASDYKLQPKVVKALERPLRNMMIKGGCRNAALLIYVNKYDLLRKEKQSEEDYMSVVSQVGNIVAAEFKWCAPLVMAANCFTIKAREPRSMEDGIIWLCSVLAHTGVDNPNK
eukprot:TRINITY_DN1411_c0_g2_i12.p1 TRINITY_DN1411_c0_g2~~TRINITY_DN1411_c0_g2_i12.p1  ORF type:complete len:141 (-),score=42.05 TRINITY_DN1411_c0_g2_i12:596-1018(-)